MSRVRNTLSGNPALAKTSSIANALPGTLLACLSTPVLPAMRPGTAKRNTWYRGKFQGMTASTTPRGWKVTKLAVASVSIGSAARKRSAFSA